MKKQCVLFCILMVAIFHLNAQINLDSLEQAINATKDSPEKVDALHKLSWKYEFDNPEKALSITSSTYELAKKLNYKKGMAQCLNDFGVCYSIQGKMEKSLYYYLQSLKIKEEIKDERGVGISYINIGQVYSDQEQFDKAMEYYNKALTQFEKIHNDLEIAATYNSIATLYDKMDKFDSARIYEERSYELRKKINDLDGISESVGNLATIYKHLGNLKKAIEYYELDLKYNEIEGNDYSRTITMNNMSLLYADLNDLNKAISTAEKSAEISEKKGYLENLKFALGNLAQFYRTKKDYATAYHYLATYFSVCDSLKNEDLSRSLNDLSIKYETEKKDQQNKLLQIQNDLSEKTIKQQRLITVFIVFGFCLMSLLAFFIFRGLKKQRIANTLISQQKDLIEEKHKEITDSINYAERIQRSFLASKEILDENLKNYFIVFKPKDVVSGDFYWAGLIGVSSNEKFMLCTADSTGHGVPGAIMSLLNITSIESAIKDGNIEPADILNHTRKTIIERLKKDGSLEGGKDGMDASLISFDFKTNKFSYSAANNPIWVVRNKELIELNPDKMPVGKHDKDYIPFTQQEFELQLGDMIYTLTDGLPDQFGGPKGKKFMYKQLKELLVSCSLENVDIQKQKIEEAIHSWKGDFEQVDDITLIGIKV